MNDFTVVVPFWNGHDTLPRLLDSIPSGLPVIVVDDHSDAAPDLSGRPNVRVVRPLSKGFFSGAVNAGLNACRSDVLILNQDAELFGTDWIELVRRERAGHAVVGEGVFNHPAWPRGYVQGTFMYVGREAVRQVGGFNADLFPLWGATADWQARACRKGFKALPLKTVPGLRHERGEPGQRFGPAITEALRRQPSRRKEFIRTPPLISVVVPCYKYGRYLADCVGSLTGGQTSLGPTAGQTFTAFDVWIVDDCSPDDETRVRARDAADDWAGVHSVRHPVNRGCPAANNTGARSSTGGFLTILSADDMREPESLAGLYEAVRRDPDLVAYDDIREFTDGKRGRALIMPEYDFKRVLEKNCMHPGILFSRASWEQVGGYSDAMRDGREDWAFNISLGLAGFCGLRVAQAGYLYRREGQNRTLTTKHTIGQPEFMSRMKRLFPDAYAGRWKVGCCGDKSAPRGAGNDAVVRRGTTNLGGLPGAAGMVEVEYVGGSAGIATWTGRVSGAQYRFGGKRRVGYVDARDVDDLLALRMDGGVAQFRHHVVPAAVKPESLEPEPVEPEPVLAVTAAPSLADNLRPDPSTMSVDQVRAFIKAAALDSEAFPDWAWMIERESQGRNRPSVIRALERAADV